MQDPAIHVTNFKLKSCKNLSMPSYIEASCFHTGGFFFWFYDNRISSTSKERTRTIYKVKIPTSETISSFSPLPRDKRYFW